VKELGRIRKVGGEDDVESLLMESSKLTDDCYIKERVERILVESNVSVGIIDDVYATSHWHLGMLGKLKWTVSSKPLPEGAVNPLCWFPDWKGIPSEPVNVILIIGSIYKLPKERWECPKLQTVISVRRPGRNRGRNRRNCRNYSDYLSHLKNDEFHVLPHVLQHHFVGV